MGGESFTCQYLRQNKVVRSKQSWVWLQNGDLKRETESLTHSIKTSTNIRLLPRNEINNGNELASLYNLQSKTQCVGFFARTCKTKHTMDGSLLFRDRKNASISILLQKVCLGWKISPIINRRGDWNKNVLGGKKSEKLICGGEEGVY